MQGMLNLISRRAMLATGIALIVVLISATIIVLAVLRGESLERAEWHLGTLASALSEQTWQSVRAVELLAMTAADELKDHHLRKGGAPDRPLHQKILEFMTMLPNVRVVAYLDARGDAILHSKTFPAPVVNHGDRDFFRAHRGRRIEGLYVGKPEYGGLAQEWLNPFSYRIEDERGGFRGTVVAAVHMPYFESRFGALNLGEGGRAFLFRDDGVLLAMHPVMEKAVGRSFSEDPLFRQALRASGSGIQRRAGLLDEESRIVAFERLNGYPLVVVVSSTGDFILSGWRRAAWQIGVGALAAVTFVGGALFFLFRQQQASAGLERDLQETGQRLRGIILSAMDAIITVDANQQIVLFNAAAERIFRCPAAVAIGGPLDRFIPERFRAAHRRHIEHFGATGATTRMMGVQIALYGVRADGEEFPIDASISQVTVDEHKFYTVILRDITERKAAEAALVGSYRELRELSSAMHEVREAERTRIARELHDELAQWLTALRMDVSWLTSRLPREQRPLLERAEKMKEVVDTTVAAVRRIAADLRPVMLDDLGLIAALESLLHDLSQRTGIIVSLDAEEAELNFGEPLASALYRMAQEALTNIARHAQATEAAVAIGINGDRLVLTVRDNGRGIDLEAMTSGKSYGILGIRERARTLGGDARIVRPASGGTLVEVAIPTARFRRREAVDDTGIAG